MTIIYALVFASMMAQLTAIALTDFGDTLLKGIVIMIIIILHGWLAMAMKLYF